MIKLPRYGQATIVELAADLERRLRGASPSSPLGATLAASIPDAASYVLVLFDGLGDRQLDHSAAAPLAADRVAVLDAPFPTTTTVALASLVTATAPRSHGLLGYQLWMPEVGKVVNTIKWTTLWGDPVDVPTRALLPSPNLWERLAASGIEPVTVQPAGFTGSPLSRALYRGCRQEPVTSVGELVEATVDLAARPGRLVFAYLPHVDVAAHVHGQGSTEYAEALGRVSAAWEALRRRLPGDVTLVGTADHGHVDVPLRRRARIPDEEGRILYGDSRATFVRGPGADLAADLPATWHPLEEVRAWWGPVPEHPRFADRAPDGILLADDGWLLLHRFSDRRLVGNHGGLTDAERLVPLLVAP